MIRTIIAAADLDVAAVASAHVNEVQPVTDDVGAIVGEKAQRSPEGYGNNATFGFVTTD